jgi:hypothetical protein
MVRVSSSLAEGLTANFLNGKEEYQAAGESPPLSVPSIVRQSQKNVPKLLVLVVRSRASRGGPGES